MARTQLFALGVVGFVAMAGSASAAVFNLAADWSDTANPNGSWAYLVNGSIAGSGGGRTGDPFNSPGAPQIWGSGYLGWSKSIGTEIALDVQAGDVYGHTGPIQIRWTSPFSGPARVSGGVWALRDIGRASDWQLLYNGVPIASGNVASGDPYSRANPMPFLQDLTLVPGDQIEFSAELGSGNLDYVGLSLSISPIPEPELTTALAGLGLVGFVFYRRKTPRA